jgi:trimethylamine--corrinoid protein Co-methyltransferase
MMREARRGRREKAGASIAQLPWEVVRNPYAPMEMLSADQMQDLHDTSIRILKELGIKVMGANARALFAAAGAKIDDEGIVRIDESIVAAALATVPRQFTLTPRNPMKRVHLGGDHLVFGLVAQRNSHDRQSGDRTAGIARKQPAFGYLFRQSRLVRLDLPLHLDWSGPGYGRHPYDGHFARDQP